MDVKCGHIKSSRLEIGYDYGAASGWFGIGQTFRCPRYCECLWFIDGSLNDFELSNNKKRKENLKYKPRKKTPPHKFKHINYNKLFKKLGLNNG